VCNSSSSSSSSSVRSSTAVLCVLTNTHHTSVLFSGGGYTQMHERRNRQSCNFQCNCHSVDADTLLLYLYAHIHRFVLRCFVLCCCCDLSKTDVVTLEKSADQFRLLYNTKGRFVLHRIKNEEATYKLCRVVKVRNI
jgi:Ribosomal family S4e